MIWHVIEGGDWAGARDRVAAGSPRAAKYGPGMSTYRGEASLILDTGRELTVAAELSQTAQDGLTDWGGTLAVPDQSKPIEMVNLQQGTLRTEHGEGQFVRPDISDWLDSPVGQFRIRILGNGDAPF